MRYFVIAAGFAFAITTTLAVGSANADMIKSDGKCWDTKADNLKWGDCKEKKDAHGKGSHHKKG
jgi:hypothetical protein